MMVAACTWLLYFLYRLVKVLESRFFTQYKSKGFGGISNWIQEVIYVLYMSSDMYKVDI